MKKLQKSLENLEKAFASLEESLATPPTENRDYAGIIQNFEFTYELTWKTLQVFLESQGISAPFPRVVLEESFKHNLIEGNEIWKKIIESRNLSAHTYDKKLAVALCKKIKDEYFIIFKLSLAKIKNAAKLP